MFHSFTFDITKRSTVFHVVVDVVVIVCSCFASSLRARVVIIIAAAVVIRFLVSSILKSFFDRWLYAANAGFMSWDNILSLYFHASSVLLVDLLFCSSVARYLCCCIESLSNATQTYNVIFVFCIAFVSTRSLCSLYSLYSLSVRVPLLILCNTTIPSDFASTWLTQHDFSIIITKYYWEVEEHFRKIKNNNNNKNTGEQWKKCAQRRNVEQ